MRRAYRPLRPPPPAVHRSDAAPSRSLSRTAGGRRYAGVPHERRSNRPTDPSRRRPEDEPAGRRRRRLRDPSDPDPTAASSPRRRPATVDVADDEADELLAQYPPVVAVVVTRNPGPWLEDTLAGAGGAGLRRPHGARRRLRLRTTTPPRGSPRVLPRAFVRRLDDGAGFADAANEALHAVEGATFLLLCHDDVVLDPSAVRLLVEEAYRSNAGIVGPKLVSADEPRGPARGRARDRPLRRARTPGSSPARSTRSSTTASATSSTSRPR